MRLYLISADRETMKEFVYAELTNHTEEVRIAYKNDMRDGSEGLYLRIGEHYEKWFLKACNAYGVTIRWFEKEAA